MSSFNISADPCLSSPCQNGGQCAGYGSGYFCFCVNGFWGWNCEVGDHCASSSCRNGGTCQSLYSGYSCSCATGYAGFNCDFPDPCLSSPCQNGGRCVSYGGVYLCHCSSTYTGLRCERDASSQDLNQDLNQDFKPNTSKKSCAELICPLFGVIGFGLIVIIAVCFVITKKRKRRQRDLQLRSGAHDVSAYFQSDTRVSTLTSVSDHPTAEHPYSVHDTSTDSQTSTCVIEHFSLSELESSHLSPEQAHLHDNEESRLDGGSVNDGYDHVRDLPPSYLSVVTDPRYIRDEGDSVQQLPSYDDVVAAVRPSLAPSDGNVTSIEVTS